MNGKGNPSVAPPELHNAVSLHSIGPDVRVTIYSGLVYTLQEAEKELGQKEVIRAYRFLSGDERLDFSFDKAKLVVLGEVQNAWYENNGYDIPHPVMSNQELRLQEALVAKKAEDQATEKAPKEKRLTVKSICETGLLAGKPEEEILAEVKKNFPEGKADMSHVRYYRHFLVKEGKLEKQPRAKKEKAEKPAKTITQAAKGEAPKAKKGSQPAKQSASKPAKAGK